MKPAQHGSGLPTVRRSPLPAACCLLPTPRRGFSFTEILFAVMILGIGFIMVAAMFPVAISQSRTSAEETTASAVARNAVSFLESAAQEPLPNVPAPDNILFRGHPTAEVVLPLSWHPMASDDEKNARWNAVKGQLIVPEDPRYAWTALYRRNPNTSIAQLYIISTTIREGPRYLPEHLLIRENAHLTPRRATISRLEDNEIVFYRQNGTVNALMAGGEAAGTGAFVIIMAGNDDSGASAAGRIYRLGNLRSRTDTHVTFELMPGHDMTYPTGPQEVITSDRPAWIIGRQLQNPTAPFDPATNPFVGTAQDIAIYTTFINVR